MLECLLCAKYYSWTISNPLADNSKSPTLTISRASLHSHGRTVWLWIQERFPPQACWHAFEAFLLFINSRECYIRKYQIMCVSDTEAWIWRLKFCFKWSLPWVQPRAPDLETCRRYLTFKKHLQSSSTCLEDGSKSPTIYWGQDDKGSETTQAPWTYCFPFQYPVDPQNLTWIFCFSHWESRFKSRINHLLIWQVVLYARHCSSQLCYIPALMVLTFKWREMVTNRTSK